MFMIRTGGFVGVVEDEAREAEVAHLDHTRVSPKNEIRRLQVSVEDLVLV